MKALYWICFKPSRFGILLLYNQNQPAITCSKLIIKALEPDVKNVQNEQQRGHQLCSAAFVDNFFEDFSCFTLMFPLLTLNK